MSASIRILLPALVASAFFSSTATRADASRLRARAESFFETYAQRTDFNAFLAFYAEDAVVEDIVNGDLVEGRQAIAAFFDWNNDRVIRTTERALVVHSLVVEDQTAIARGHFTPFLYDGKPYGPWRFVIALDFDPTGHIVRHEDFINYPAELLNPDRPSSNSRIPNGPHR